MWPFNTMRPATWEPKHDIWKQITLCTVLPLILLCKPAVFRLFLDLWPIPYISARSCKSLPCYSIKAQPVSAPCSSQMPPHLCLPCTLPPCPPLLPAVTSSLPQLGALQAGTVPLFLLIGQHLGQSTQASLLKCKLNKWSKNKHQASPHVQPRKWPTMNKKLWASKLLINQKHYSVNEQPKFKAQFAESWLQSKERHFSTLPISENHKTSQQSNTACWRRLLGDLHILLLVDHNISALSKLSFKEFKLSAILLQLPTRSNQCVATAGYQQHVHALKPA